MKGFKSRVILATDLMADDYIKAGGKFWRVKDSTESLYSAGNIIAVCHEANVPVEKATFIFNQLTQIKIYNQSSK